MGYINGTHQIKVNHRRDAIPLQTDQFGGSGLQAQISRFAQDFQTEALPYQILIQSKQFGCCGLQAVLEQPYKHQHVVELMKSL